MDQIITSKTPKLGPDNNSTAYIYIYIYTAGLQGGPKTIENTAAREPAKSCEGARRETRRPKHSKNRGLQTSEKASKNMSFCRSGGPALTQNATRRRFSIRFGLPRSSSNSAVFWVSAIWPQSGNCRNASFLRVSRLVVFLGRLNVL